MASKWFTYLVYNRSMLHRSFVFSSSISNAISITWHKTIKSKTWRHCDDLYVNLLCKNSKHTKKMYIYATMNEQSISGGVLTVSISIVFHTVFVHSQWVVKLNQLNGHGSLWNDVYQLTVYCCAVICWNAFPSGYGWKKTKSIVNASIRRCISIYIKTGYERSVSLI